MMGGCQESCLAWAFPPDTAALASADFADFTLGTPVGQEGWAADPTTPDAGAIVLTDGSNAWQPSVTGSGIILDLSARSFDVNGAWVLTVVLEYLPTPDDGGFLQIGIGSLDGDNCNIRLTWSGGPNIGNAELEDAVNIDNQGPIAAAFNTPLTLVITATGSSLHATIDGINAGTLTPQSMGASVPQISLRGTLVNVLDVLAIRSVTLVQ